MRWSEEKIWQWYRARPWIRGCNYMSADCANRIDQWQEYGFEERFQTEECELDLMKKTGFNMVRLIPEFFVWENEHDGFMERFERTIDAAARRGISCMIVLGNDCMPPYEEAMARLHLGEQTVALGYHGGRKISQHGVLSEPGYSLLDDPAMAERHYVFVRELVTKYKNDERILLWDVFNEPGNSRRGTMSLPHIKKFVEIIREIDPIQPLTIGIWSRMADFDKLPEEERYCLEVSDIISYHNYGTYEENIREIQLLKKYGRPLINTEWLNRCRGNSVELMFPLFYLEKVGCCNWGFVAGKYQTYEPYNGVWERYEKDPQSCRNFDFTKWFHDLYRPSHHPYNPHEIELIQKYCAYADADFGEGEWGR